MVCGEQRQTYRELHDRAQQLVHGLRALGLSKGDRVALLVDNGPACLEQIVGLALGGFVRTGLYTHDAPERQRYLLELTGAAALVVDSHHYESLESMLGDCPDLRHVIVVGDSRPAAGALETARVHSYDATVHGASTEPVEIDVRPEELHQVRFSAGTTGLPKGIVHDLAGWLAVGEGTVAALETPVTSADCYLAAGPLTHAASMLIWPVLDAGGSIVVLPAFDVRHFLAAVEEQGVTMTLLVPTMVQLILDNPESRRRDLSSLRAVFYGASPMPESALVAALELWGNVMYQLYGQSEAVPATALTPAHHVVDGTAAERARLRSAGKPVGGSAVRILDEDDEEVPPGTVGEVVVRTAGRMLELWNDPEATRARLTEDGWVRTRDMGWLDEEGFLFLADRKEDMIISGGFNIWPAELENALTTHPAVRAAAVVGVPHPRWGETPHAVVVLAEGEAADVTEEALIEWTRSTVGSVKKVTRVSFVDELPTTPVGKVLRRVVRENLRA